MRRAVGIVAMIFVFLALLPAPAAHAQRDFMPDPVLPYPGNGFRGFSDAPSSLLEVRWVQHASGGDAVELGGLDPVSDYRSFDLARSVGDAIGVSRERSSVTSGTYSSSSSGDFYAGVQIEMDDRLVRRDGSHWALDIDGGALATVAGRYGFSDLRITTCPVDVAVEDESSRPADIAGNCPQWSVSTVDVASAPRIRLIETPNPASYWRAVGVITGIAVAVALAATLLAVWIRRKFLKTLSAANLTVIILLTVAAVFAASVATLVLGFAHWPINDFVLAHDLDDGEHFLAFALPAFTCAWPFLVPALLFARAAPRVYDDATSAAVMHPYAHQPSRGVPSWLHEPSSDVPRSASAPDVPVSPATSEEPPREPEAPPWHPPS